MKKSKRSGPSGTPSATSHGKTAKKKAGLKDLPAAEAGAGLDALLTRLGIKDWDVLLVGDGSGSHWGRACGWASVLIERSDLSRRVWYGSTNFGTVNLAEIMAYLQPLTWLQAREHDRHEKHGKPRRVLHVHIVTDSEYCKNTGKSRAGSGAAKNGVLWAAFDVLARQGLLLHWHWLRRGECALNSYCDLLSKLARSRTGKYNLQEKLEAGGHQVGEADPSSA